jgi:hypothetical protein
MDTSIASPKFALLACPQSAQPQPFGLFTLECRP